MKKIILINLIICLLIAFLLYKVFKKKPISTEEYLKNIAKQLDNWNRVNKSGKLFS